MVNEQCPLSGYIIRMRRTTITVTSQETCHKQIAVCFRETKRLQGIEYTAASLRVKYAPSYLCIFLRENIPAVKHFTFLVSFKNMQVCLRTFQATRVLVATEN